MKIKDLQSKTDAELQEMLVKEKKDSLNNRFSLKAGNLKNTSLIAKGRKTVAQIKTILSMRANAATQDKKEK